jgi:hypothetical protein
MDAVLKMGTLMISSLQYIRDLEGHNGAWIGDRLEGATELSAPDSFVLTEGSNELQIANQANMGNGMFKTFANASSGGMIDLSGTRFISVTPQLYIYSFSEGDLEELRVAMCVDSPEPYDACLRLLSPWNLLKAVIDLGEVVELNALAKDVFWGGAIDRVNYGPVSKNILDGASITPSPFLKDVNFAKQREHRIIFEPKNTIAEQRLTIKLPNSRDLFNIEFAPE